MTEKDTQIQSETAPETPHKNGPQQILFIVVVLAAAVIVPALVALIANHYSGAQQATAVGALLPLAAARFGIDPALVSGPMMSTLVDATGLLIYFSIAQYILGL